MTSLCPGIRVATPDDADALARLAAISASRPPRGRALVAEQDARIIAAIGLTNGAVLSRSGLFDSRRRELAQARSLPDTPPGRWGRSCPHSAPAPSRRRALVGPGAPTGRRRSRVGIAVAGVVIALAAAASAAAFQALPPGGQVNDDPAAGINKALSVSGEDPTNADVVGGALTAGKPAVPWAVFRQQENGTSQPHDQIFSRSFAGGAWTTRGSGTVGGRSSASPTFSGSLNFDQGQDGEAPAIDFAGAGRTVPWATWYENTTGTGFGKNNIFASRFDNTPRASGSSPARAAAPAASAACRSRR